MKIKIVEQIEFSTVLFDSLFGLILFFSFASFLDIKELLPFTFYLFTTIILIHWWLIFKSADDAFAEEVNDSAIDLVFGIIYIILLEYIVLMSSLANYIQATYFLIALLAVDLIWALVWRYIGEWETHNIERIGRMEKELNHNIIIDIVTIVLFILLSVCGSLMSPWLFVTFFIALYIIYIILTFSTKIIDLKIF